MATGGGSVATQFKPGAEWRGNPGGKPTGTKNRVTSLFLEALAADFEKGGPAAIKKARLQDPTGYCRIFASMVPKELDLSGEGAPVFVIYGRAPAESEEDWIEKHGQQTIEHKPNGKGNGGGNGSDPA